MPSIVDSVALARPKKPQWKDAFRIIEPQISADGVHHWPFPPGLPVDVSFWAMEGQHNIRLNCHAYFELLYGLDGEAVYEIQGKHFSVGRGDLIMVGPSLYHRVKDYHREPFCSMVLYFLPDALCSDALAGEEAEYLAPFLLPDDVRVHLIPKRNPLARRIYLLMRRIAAELPAETSLQRLAARTYLRQILLELVKHGGDSGNTLAALQRREEALQRLRPLFQFIEHHCAEPISLDQAAATVHMSRSHFSRFFRTATGQSFATYLTRFRMARAQALLASSQMSILEVSQAVGYSDQSYFGTTFRRVVRLTPRAYRYRVTEAIDRSPHRGRRQSDAISRKMASRS